MRTFAAIAKTTTAAIMAGAVVAVGIATVGGTAGSDAGPRIQVNV
jgi:hypothetical protein